ncbi:TNF receptor-associated factor 1-like [Orbicella faveolata]|uniref:TNF receptor-associated factor 1-like n=1 Tax=Orbicella faveolata TaxID=48498 RepID=UPI0009E28C00|nr:TNF receptor-associated factor 1-like [Orbicella faveolata]
MNSNHILNVQLKSHLDLACGELRDTQENVKEKITYFHRLEERLNILDERLEEKVDHTQHQLRNSVDFLQQQYQRRVGILQEQLEQKVKTCQTKLEQKIIMKRTMFWACLVLGLVFLTFYLTKLEKNVDILKVDTEESRIFIWKITSFEDKLREGKIQKNWVIQSDPFYGYGYKLILQLYPNGCGVGKDTYLSISIGVLKGEYDAIFPWGLSKPVIFALIDQQDNPNQRQNLVMGFLADPNNAVFKKPVEEKNSLMYGFLQFVSHNDLKTRRFVVDDTSFIKVQLDSPKAKKLWF